MEEQRTFKSMGVADFIAEEMAEWETSDNIKKELVRKENEEINKRPNKDFGEFNYEDDYVEPSKREEPVKKKWKAKKVEYFYVWKDDILSADFTEDWFDKVMEGSEDFANCKNDRDNGIDTSEGKDYCKLPVELLMCDDAEYELDKNDYICLALATWLFTYSRINHSLSFKKIKARFPSLDKETIEKAIEEQGEKYLLEVRAFKDKFKRKHRQVVMDFDGYYNRLGYARKDK